MSTTTATTGHTHCVRCGRKLSAADSRARGYGRTCGKAIKTALAALTGFKDHQIDNAAELLAEGGAVKVDGDVLEIVSATDPAVTYKTHPKRCNCPAATGSTPKLCWHRAVALAVAA